MDKEETTITIEKASETEISIIVQEPAPQPKVETVTLDSLIALSEQYTNDLAFIAAQKVKVDAQIAEARDLGVKRQDELAEGIDEK